MQGRITVGPHPQAQNAPDKAAVSQPRHTAEAAALVHPPQPVQQLAKHIRLPSVSGAVHSTPQHVVLQQHALEGVCVQRVWALRGVCCKQRPRQRSPHPLHSIPGRAGVHVNGIQAGVQVLQQRTQTRHLSMHRGHVQRGLCAALTGGLGRPSGQHAAQRLHLPRGAGDAQCVVAP